MRTEITRMLYAAGGYLSGEEISKKFKITRAAVWKHIKALQKDGCKIDAVTNRGYKLEKMPDLLKPEYMGVYVKSPVKLIWVESVNSTNTYLKTAARRGAPTGTVAVTEHQTGGKGRLGREWSAKKGDAVLLSVLRRTDTQPQHAPGYNFAAALAVCRALRDTCGVDARIKWPNDVVVGGRKICGILTEMSADMDRVEYIICGVGVNCNQRRFAGELEDRAVSARMVTGKKADRTRLAAALVDEIEKAFDEFEAGGLACMMDEYCEKSAILGERVTVSGAHGDFCGMCVGFGEGGELLVEEGGEKRSFHAGDITLRGEAGYV